MQVGINLPTYGHATSPAAIRDAALLAEALGFDSVWVPDHIMVAQDEPTKYNIIFESLSTLAWLAALTERIKIGTSVLIVPQRNAVVLAKQLATIDQLSAGRLFVGIGSGWSRAEFGHLGVPFQRRGALTNEVIDVMRALWTTPEAPFHGSTYDFEGHSFAPGPFQPGGPPLWIGGDSEAALRRAAERGDGWHGGPRMSEPSLFAAAAEQIASLAGGRSIELTLRVNIGDVTGEIDNPGHSGSVFKTYAIGGSPNDIRAQLARLAELGCSHVVANFYEGDIESMDGLMRRFARDVLPALQSR